MKIVPATPVHLTQVAEAIRESDRQEVLATSGQSPLVAVAESAKSSVWTFACVDDEGVAFAVFGVASSLPSVGFPWLLATDNLKEHRVEFLEASRNWIAEISQRYPLLMNYVDERNTRSIQWLKFIGFKILPAVPYGVAGLPFHPFVKVSHV